MSASNRGTDRIDQDLYQTPAYCVDLILGKIDFSKVSLSLEPCKASGRIFNRLSGNKIFAEISEGIDYLGIEFSDIDLIITNPPFSLAEEFLRKSLSEASCVIYMLRLNYLGSKKRKKLFDEFPLTHLYVLCKRPSFTGQGTDATEYAWFVWDRKGIMTDAPGIYVLGDDGNSMDCFDTDYLDDL